jgi:hypothetical protein
MKISLNPTYYVCPQKKFTNKLIISFQVVLEIVDKIRFIHN